MAKVKETYHMAPFSQEVGTEGKFVSFYTQREAQYKDAPDSVFNYKKLPLNELEIQSYKDIIVAPSPAIKEVDGFKSEEEVTPTNEPTEEPSEVPSNEPTEEPSEVPSNEPSEEPTPQP